jgi:hypothetical protein
MLPNWSVYLQPVCEPSVNTNTYSRGIAEVVGWGRTISQRKLGVTFAICLGPGL